MSMSAVSMRVRGIVVHLELYVLIFHLLPKEANACLLIFVMCLNLYGPDVFCVISSAKPM